MPGRPGGWRGYAGSFHRPYLMTTTSLNSLNRVAADAEMPSQAALIVRRTAFVGLALTVGAVQFSIAVAEIMAGFTLAAWIVMLAIEHRRPAAPAWMTPLLFYGGWTLLSAAFSPDPASSFTDCKQLVLLLLVPMTYDIVDEDSAPAQHHTTEFGHLQRH